MDALATAPLKWIFGSCQFEESSLELSVNGTPVELERKPLEVLRHLLRHAGEVVTKEELLASVWPGRVLSDTVLTKAISRIREVLRDETQGLVKTVHGYGYRLIVPVRVEMATEAAMPVAVLGLKEGDGLPLRPQWQLTEHLGSGGSGEVWKLVHGKTGDVRVCKFALNGEALNTLKREITLFRLLRQQLGPSAAIAEILDWNLEEAPYFLELAHYPAGNLSTWAQSQGGLSQIPLAERVRLLADIAAAVAAAHGVGVLHKDLKASNILMQGKGASARPVLADFGGGGVLGDEVIANAGITRMGFTQLFDAPGQGTPLYVAPEVLEGQPQTLRSDIYALGVLLYQLCVGDFRKPIAPGWEQGIDDELLRADIADAVHGNPERRLASAQALAERLRDLPGRREALTQALRLQHEQRAAAEAAEAAHRKIEQLHARRTGLLVALVVLVLGLITSLVLYRKAVVAQAEAEHSRAVAEAVSGFLNYDVLAATEEEGRDTRNLTAQQLLDDAAKRVDARFADQPEAGANIHTALSSSFMQIGDTESAIFHRGRGWDISKELQHSDPEAALRLAVELAPVDFTRDEDDPFWREMRDVAIKRWGAKDARTLLLRNAVALEQGRQRQAAQAVESYTGIVRDAEQIPGYDIETLATHWEDLGQQQARLARFAEAEQAYLKALDLYASLYGAASFAAATAEIRYAELMMVQGRYAEAETQLQQALTAGRAQRNSRNALVIKAQRGLAMLRTEQGRLNEAEALVNTVREAETLARGERSQQVVHTGYLLAQIRALQGRFAEAEKLLKDTLIAQEQVPVLLLYGQQRKAAERLAYQQLLVRVLVAQGKQAEAQSLFKQLLELKPEASALSPLETAEWLTTQGRVLHGERQTDQARSLLSKALTIYQGLLGEGHPLTKKARVAAAE